MDDQFDSKNVYLTKDNVIVGIHAIGYSGPYEYDLVELDGTETRKTSDFQVIEIWGNEYDEEHNMLGRGSFRVHTHDFDQEVRDWEADGWVKRDAPIRKENAKT